MGCAASSDDGRITPGVTPGCSSDDARITTGTLHKKHRGHRRGKCDRRDHLSDEEIEKLATDLPGIIQKYTSDPDELIEIAGSRNVQEIARIAAAFKRKQGQCIVKYLANAILINKEDYCAAMICSLFSDPALFDAEYIYRALHSKAFGRLTTEEDLGVTPSLPKEKVSFADSLTFILCTRTDKELQAIKATYEQYFKTKLVDDIITRKSGKHGKLEKLFVDILQTTKISSDEDKVGQDVETLHANLQHPLNTHSDALIHILAKSTRRHRHLVYREYLRKYDTLLDQALRNHEKSLTWVTDFGRALGVLVRPVQMTHAQSLHEAFMGARRSKTEILRVFVSQRARYLVSSIKIFHEEWSADQSMEQWVRNETQGSYQKLLLTVLEHHGGT